MALVGVNKYVDTSASSDGDGSFDNPYNSIQSALSNAPNNPSSESDRWLIWVRRLNSGTTISVTSTLSPSNDGSINAPHLLIGYPFRKQLTGLTVDAVPAGTDTLGMNKAKWQFIDSELTEGDFFWIGATVTWTSGNNSGLSRKVIFFKQYSDASTVHVWLDFPLPNDIAAGDQYTIELKTDFYDDRPSEASSWDSDTNEIAILDGSGITTYMFAFGSDYWWQMHNFDIRNGYSSGYVFNYVPSQLSFIRFHDHYKGFYGSNYLQQMKNFYSWEIDQIYAIQSIHSGCTVEDCHFQGSASASTHGFSNSSGVLKNCTSGRVYPCSVDLRNAGIVRGENVILASATKVSLSEAKYGSNFGDNEPKVSISGYNCEPDKFHEWNFVGEIYNVDEDGTIDPPSGATTYIKLKPNSYCNDEYPLIHNERRYQSSGSKTYTWKFYPTGWSSLSTSDIEVEAWYLDESSGAHRAYTTANPSSVTNDTWNDLSITVNPAQAGTVYFKIKLKKYESTSAYIALDPKVDVS